MFEPSLVSSNLNGGILDILIKKYLWVLNLIGVIFCAYFLAKLASVFIADQLLVDRKFSLSTTVVDSASSKNLPTFDQYQVILDRNIFDSKEVAAQNVQQAETQSTAQTVDPNGTAVRTSLAVKLMSTFSVGNGMDQRSSATVQSGNTQDVYTVGDEKQFSPGVKITKILSDRIEFINAGRLEFVELEKVSGSNAGGGAKSDSGSRGQTSVSSGQSKLVIDQAQVDSALNNLGKIITEAQAVANMVGGKPAGIRLVAVKPNSFFAKLNLQKGDVIERINGAEMDMGKALDVFNQLKGEKHISIDMIRNGQKQTLDYEIR